MLNGEKRIEMEDGVITPYTGGTINAGFIEDTSAGASGGRSLRAAVEAPPDNSITDVEGIAAPVLKTTLLVNSPQTYHVWLRACIDAESQGSLWYRIGNGAYRRISLPANSEGEQGSWKWTKLGLASLPAGLTEMGFIPGSDGGLFDELLVTEDPEFDPNDAENRGNSFETAIQITPPVQVNGEIAEAGADVYYRFIAAQTGNYIFNLTQVTQADYTVYRGDSTDTAVHEQLASSVGMADKQMVCSLSQSVPYYVKVSSANSGVQTFVLSIQAEETLTSTAFTTDTLAVGDELTVKTMAKGVTAGHVFKLSYDADKLQLLDIARQRYETVTQPGIYGGLTVVAVEPGAVTFKPSAEIAEGSSWAGLLTIFGFQAVTEGQSSITLETI